MIVAAHQPSYLPWLGYLDKMAKSDLFVVMDDLQYEAQNFQNRQRVKLHSGAAWLTVPLERGAQADLICDKRIDNSGSPKQHWQRRTWMTIEMNYRRAPYFDRYAGALREVYARPWTSLVELDMTLLDLARTWLEIKVPIVRSSSLDLKGQKTDRIIDLCKKVGARAYLSGSGGSTGYLDVEQMGRSGIGVIWQHFDHPRYPQRYAERGFCSHLAFLDLLFNCGEQSRDVLFDRSHPLRAFQQEVA
ncbi:MAG: WbqC-like family protein [Myxococcales bacterium]|nr:WbqC-like family protein [Myxococcales bacterium]